SNRSSDVVAEVTESEEIVETPAAEDALIDTDNDGLTDAEEADFGTDSGHADYDGDGLADGDEVKLFQTSPITIHSDADRYDDGKEVKDGYTPLTPGETRFTDSEIQKVVEAFKAGNVHEPT